MSKAVSAETFLRLAEEASWVVVDVRAPKEYADGHIPGALSVPLFDDTERAEIGTLYKQEGREPAFLRGLELVGPKLADFVRTAASISPDRKLLVHCWRGGMRSGSLATLWSRSGFEVMTLEGGYKAYRAHIRQQLANPLKLIVLGGMTGSGKTAMLHSLKTKGQQIIDLEGLAHHKGSAFGAIGEQPQPSTEQFENDLYRIVSDLDPERPVWIEDESRMIGRVFLPDPLWEQMEQAPVVRVDVPREVRIDNLLRDYADGDPEEAREAILKISKRMDGKAVKEALAAIDQGEYHITADLALDYYDKFYLKSLRKRNQNLVFPVKLDHGNPDLAADTLIETQPELLNPL